MAFRIYVDESGTHGNEWLIIGMLFVPAHAALHNDLCQTKDRHDYLNKSPKHSAKYKEVHLAHCRSPRDVLVCKEWIDVFLRHTCYYRSVVVDWSIWESRYFGNAFDPEALNRRRAYKKWAEMLLHPELKSPTNGLKIFNAELYLDKLKIMYGYDVLSHLQDRFTENYRGGSPYIEKFQHTDSKADANQCLQLCDLLTGCLYQSLVPSNKDAKRLIAAHLEEAVRPLGVTRLASGFWEQFDPKTLNNHFPKFSAWFWRPNDGKKRGKKK